MKGLAGRTRTHPRTRRGTRKSPGEQAARSRVGNRRAVSRIRGAARPAPRWSTRFKDLEELLKHRPLLERKIFRIWLHTNTNCCSYELRLLKSLGKDLQSQLCVAVGSPASSLCRGFHLRCIDGPPTQSKKIGNRAVTVEEDCRFFHSILLLGNPTSLDRNQPSHQRHLPCSDLPAENQIS